MTNTPNVGTRRNVDRFYGDVMKWLMFSFGSAALGAFLIGPLIAPSMVFPLSIIVLIGLIVGSFTRIMVKHSDIFVIAVPTALGIILYPVLNHYATSGNGNVIVSALIGTAITFGTAAVLGWRSERSLQHWGPRLFVITLGIIGVSLLNTFLFQLGFLSTLLSVGVVIVFTIYTFIDLNAIRNRSYGSDVKPSFYALQVFLDIYNIFSAFLNIFR